MGNDLELNFHRNVAEMFTNIKDSMSFLPMFVILEIKSPQVGPYFSKISDFPENP